jgi:hypothetical protein
VLRTCLNSLSNSYTLHCRAAQARQVSASLCKLSVELKNTTFKHQREARTAVSRGSQTLGRARWVLDVSAGVLKPYDDVGETATHGGDRGGAVYDRPRPHRALGGGRAIAAAGCRFCIA